jgi:hypothetical protein
MTYFKTLMAALVVAAFWTIDTEAAEDGRRGKGGKAKFLERFDVDGDGTLSEKEKAAAREAMQKTGKGRPQAAAGGAKAPAAGEWQQADGPVADGGRRPGGKGGKGGGPGGKMHAEMIKNFDKDGDGTLNEAERQAAKAVPLQGFDTNGDGQVSEEERKAGFLKRLNENPEMLAKFLARFDANKDGELTIDELPAGGGPGGKPGKGGKRPDGAAGKEKRGPQGKPGGGIGAPPVDKAI